MKKSIKGNIEDVIVDAIVNSTEYDAYGTGKLDIVLHRAAGAEMMKACKNLSRFSVGEVSSTPAFKLPAKFVFHAFVPTWIDGNHNEEELLAQCYWNALVLATQNNCKSISFPNLGTGRHGFPKIEAAHIAIQTVLKYLKEVDNTIDIIFVCHDLLNYKIFQEICPQMH
jgi:O-acetyl-ADP-ribose deacetylase (regulator of RNase III)